MNDVTAKYSKEILAPPMVKLYIVDLNQIVLYNNIRFIRSTVISNQLWYHLRQVISLILT
jgi:hypothetical protein